MIATPLSCWLPALLSSCNTTISNTNTAPANNTRTGNFACDSTTRTAVRDSNGSGICAKFQLHGRFVFDVQRRRQCFVAWLGQVRTSTAPYVGFWSSSVGIYHHQQHQQTQRFNCHRHEQQHYRRRQYNRNYPVEFERCSMETRYEFLRRHPRCSKVGWCACLRVKGRQGGVIIGYSHPPQKRRPVSLVLGGPFFFFSWG